MSTTHQTTRKPLRKLVLGAALALSALATSVPAAAQTLIVSAAASLTNAFKEINILFEQTNPGVKVDMTTGGSGTLLQQIAGGAPADVFASANQSTMDRAQTQNLIDASTRRNFVSNSLVVIVPAQSKTNINNLAALRQSGIARIAIGKTDNTVPVGTYTKRVLEESGDWNALSAKFIPGDNVRQVLDYVARGEVDAGFVYATDAALMKERVRVVLTPPTSSPITYPIAVIATSKQARLAGQYVAFVASNGEARAVLDKYGFGKP